MEKFMVIGFLLVVILGLGSVCVYPYATAKTETITVGKMWIKTAGEQKQIYMVSDEHKNPYCVMDCVGRLHFRATDVYLKLEVGKTYKVTYYGWRIPVVSGYPNIFSAVPMVMDTTIPTDTNATASEDTKTNPDSGK